MYKRNLVVSHLENLNNSILQTDTGKLVKNTKMHKGIVLKELCKMNL